MKQLITYTLLLTSLLFISCEDVVTLDLDTAKEKLVIDAILKTEGNTSIQAIKLSKTTAFYADQTNPQLNAQVWITTNTNNTFYFIDENNNGNYICRDFEMDVTATYTLHVISENELYEASTEFKSTPEIEDITITENAGFSGEDYEIKIWFQDNENEENFYQLIENSEGYNQYKISNDKFTNGNLMYFLLLNDELASGDSFNISFSETSKLYYEYMNRILNISQDSGNPFASPIGEIRGNILNTTNALNYPLGYFSLLKQQTRTVLIP